MEHALHFNIDGGYIAEIARSRVIEGNWQHGLKILVEGLEGMTYDLAISILSGEKTLVGSTADEAGIDIVDSPDSDKQIARFRDTLAFQTKGLFNYRNKFWRPYAVVTSWGVEDQVFASRVSDGRERPVYLGGVGDQSSKDSHGITRSLFYANNPHQDMAVLVPVGTSRRTRTVLCEEIQAPPFWVNIPKLDDPALGLTSQDRIPALEERGNSIRFGSSEPLSGAKKKLTGFSKPAMNDTTASATEELTDEELDAQFNAKLARYVTAIQKQATAGDGFLDLNLLDAEENTVSLLKVPVGPFMRWVLQDIPEELGIPMPTWQPVCPSGLKMVGDNPYHSDWVLGAGLPLENAYEIDSPEQKAAWRKREDLLKKLCSFECVVLSGKGSVFGEVVHPKPGERVSPGSIAVIPHAGPEYQLALESACSEGRGAVICEIGGKLAHLAIVSRELSAKLAQGGSDLGARLVMQSGALSKYAEGSGLMVDCDNHTITLSYA